MTDTRDGTMTEIYSGPEWDELSALFGAYLNQDWQDEYGNDVWDAVGSFRSGESATAVTCAADQVRRILDADHDEEQLRAITDHLGIEYHPPADGWTYNGWLVELEKFLRSGADT
jgi:hypothetical protein